MTSCEASDYDGDFGGLNAEANSTSFRASYMQVRQAIGFESFAVRSFCGLGWFKVVVVLAGPPLQGIPNQIERSEKSLLPYWSR